MDRKPPADATIEPQRKKPRRVGVIALEDIKTVIPASQLPWNNRDIEPVGGLRIPSQGIALPFDIDESDPILQNAISETAGATETAASANPERTDAASRVAATNIGLTDGTASSSGDKSQLPTDKTSDQNSINAHDNSQWSDEIYETFPITIAAKGSLSGTLGLYDATPDMIKRFKCHSNQNICKVTGMTPDGIGTASGLRVGDFFVKRIDAATVALEDYESVFDRLKSAERPLTLLIARLRSQSSKELASTVSAQPQAAAGDASTTNALESAPIEAPSQETLAQPTTKEQTAAASSGKDESDELNTSSTRSERTAVAACDKPSLPSGDNSAPSAKGVEDLEWETMFQRFCKVGEGTTELKAGIETDQALAAWIVQQRSLSEHGNGQLSKERIRQLESNGLAFGRPAVSGPDSSSGATSEPCDTVVADKRLIVMNNAPPTVTKRSMQVPTPRSTGVVANQDKGAPTADWLDMFHALVAYKEKHGTFVVPNNVVHCGKNLSFWLQTQRRLYKNKFRNTKPFLSQQKIDLFRSISLDLDPLGRLSNQDNVPGGTNANTEPPSVNLGSERVELELTRASRNAEKMTTRVLSQESENDSVTAASGRPALADSGPETESARQTQGHFSAHEPPSASIAVMNDVVVNDRLSHGLPVTAGDVLPTTPVCEAAERAHKERCLLESRVMSWLDRRICAAEESAYMDEQNVDITLAEKNERRTAFVQENFLKDNVSSPISQSDCLQFASEERKYLEEVSLEIEQAAAIANNMYTQMTLTDTANTATDTRLEVRNNQLKCHSPTNIAKKQFKMKAFLPSFQVLNGMNKPLWTFDDIDKIARSVEAAPNMKLQGALTVKECKDDDSTICLELIGSKEVSEQIMSAIGNVLGRRCRAHEKCGAVIGVDSLVTDIDWTNKDLRLGNPAFVKETYKAPPSLNIVAADRSREAPLKGVSPKVVSYTHFAKKVKDAIDIEWKQSKIASTFVSGRMWARHKRMFGFLCDDACKCVFSLGSLSATVVADKLRDLSKEDWTNPLALTANKMPVGFVSAYADKFLPRLQEKYPLESPAALLGRLVKMWHVHETACNNVCECDANMAMESPSKFVATVDALQSVIPRKRKVYEVEPSSTLLSSGKDTKKAEALATTGGLVANNSEYEVDFRASDPLGFFCVSYENHIHESACKIASVAPNGQARSLDTRIQGGTIIMSASNEGNMERVSTLAHLQELYERAHRNKGSLRLSLSNKDVTTLTMAQAEDLKSHWSSGGKWKDTTLKGWAGESPRLLEYAPVVHPDRLAESAVQVLPTAARTDIPVDAPDARARSKWIMFESTRNVVGHCQAPPILKQRTSAGEKYGSAGKATTQAPSKEDLLQALQLQGFKETITLLQRGAAADIESPDALTILLKDVINPSLVNTAAQLKINPNDKTLANIHRDLFIKKQLLKICERQILAVKKVKALKKWAMIELQILSIHDLSLNSVAESGSQLVLAVLNRHDEPPIAKLPMMPFASCVKYTESPIYETRVNVLLESRQWDIHVSQRYSNGVQVLLGSVSVSAKFLEEFFQGKNKAGDGEEDWQTVDCDIVPTSTSKLIGGRMLIKFRKVDIDAKVFEKKRKEAIQAIKLMFDWMKQFNIKELHDSEREMYSLSVNMRISQQPLLDTAIQLEEPELIRQAMDLGAVASTSALLLAEKLEENLSSCERSDSNSTSTFTNERRARIKQIINLLGNLESETLQEVLDVTDPPTSTSPSPDRVMLEASPETDAKIVKVQAQPEQDAGPHRKTELSKLPVPDMERPKAPARQWNSLPLVAASCRQKETSELSDLNLERPQPRERSPTQLSAETGFRREPEASERPELDLDWPQQREQSPSTLASRKEVDTPVLPGLDLERWILSRDRKHACCSHQYRGGCRSARTNCRFIHINSLWGPANFESLWSSSKSSFTAEVERLVDRHATYRTWEAGNGTEWFTAKYSSVATGENSRHATDQHVILAEGQPCQPSWQGICWYRSKEEARRALEKTVHITFYAYQINKFSALGGPAKLLQEIFKNCN
ncbi:hypothetical protein MPSEU_001015000 [Mayamaea pseudoterrestris]|nr:hypothetical protein MPSEU_001015000 [Mayamaea pseudoterrestris]